MNRQKKSITSLRFIGFPLLELESRLLTAGDRALALRDYETIRLLGSHDSLVSHYWRAVYLHHAGQHDKADELLRRVIAIAPEPVKARALVSLGSFTVESGDIGQAYYCFKNARRLAGDPLTALQSLRMSAVLLSLSGQHQKALDALGRTGALTRIIPRGHPVCLDLQNSVAVELIALGQARAAVSVLQSVMLSPVATRYAEWVDTAKQAHALLAVDQRAKVVVTREPARVLAFPERPRDSDETRLALQTVHAITAAGNASSQVAATIIALSRATPETVTCCQEVLASTGHNLELAKRAPRLTPDVAEYLLKIAHRHGLAEGA